MPPVAALIAAIVGLFLTFVTGFLCYLVVLSERQPQHRPMPRRTEPARD